MNAISERNFEDTIEAVLLAGGPDDRIEEPRALKERFTFPGEFTPGGYCRRLPDDYDPALCLIPQDAMAFVQATQPKEWQKLKRQYGDETRARFLRRLSREVERRGTLDVLRKGIRDVGARIQMVYFLPSSGLNPELQKKYRGNVFSVVRQLRYREKGGESLDLALFLNGLPIFTAELKDPLTGQTWKHAVAQYIRSRDPREPLFAFGRCLAHFAVDPNEVHFATHLRGGDTMFFPFNLGYNGGKGNPPGLKGYATAYLWEQVWARDSVLDLIQKFIHVVEEIDDRGQLTGERRLIFPRYHQLEAVRRLVQHARQNGPGRRYLIQHSAGSGKSYSISWLAHQLSVLHDDQDRAVFDTIIVVTDRRVLDRQLREHVRQFQQVRGVVQPIEGTSQELRQALEQGKKIIVTTLQKFPVIEGEIQSMAGSRFAVIIDEAHSSQSGETARSLRAVLATESLEEAERLDAEAAEETLEDLIVAEIQKRGRLRNVSHFAITATPKPKTLELFGARNERGQYDPFSIYSMRQAIEEGFILDVLENYTTYRTYWNLLKHIEDDPRYDRRKAAYLLRRFVDLHELTIAKKLEIMVEHFHQNVRHRIGGKAKAMIVTCSRLHAVRYKQAMDRYLKEKDYDFKALVAFSGTVDDGGIKYTESQMNRFSESQTAEAFKRDEYRFLIVAEKFQTGFDMPLLYAMYVDKRLSGLHAVQTLSRLNRTYPGKDGTMVLDFVNEAEDIQKAFEPYYERTILSEGTDPHLLYELEARIEEFGLFSRQEIDRFAREYFKPNPNQALLIDALRPAVDRFKSVKPEEQEMIRSALGEFVRVYAFLSQVVTFADAELEKLYHFCRYLVRLVPRELEALPLEVIEAVDLESLRLVKASEGSIALPRGRGELEPQGAGAEGMPRGEELEPLSEIIRELNERFGADLTDQDRLTLQQLEEALAQDPAVENSVRINTPENARLTFDHAAEDRVQDLLESNFRLYKRIVDDPTFRQVLFDALFDRYLRMMGAQGAH